MSKSSSNIVRFNLKNNNKDIQGGEKKVMKKSLSVILTTAMALSMFSSVAFGKTSADFTDLKDLDAATKAKFDALISAGIFDGTSETTFGLKEEMNRAQFAKVAALITGIEVNKDLKTSSFSDVKSDDAANGYALPYIEALKTAGITDGYGVGTYNPAGKVTKEQLATFLVRVLGKDADAKAKTGTDATVTDWAQGYVALALELKLLPAGADGKFGGQSNATRDLLLTGAYEAKAQYVSPGKVSVTEAKAAGVYKVTVTFNKPVDTEKVKIDLKKGSSLLTLSTEKADAPVWSTDKKSVTVTTTTRIGAGEYTATISGLDAATVDKTSATFTATDEQVSKIDFVNAGDTIAYSRNAAFKVKATNQYGEATALGTSSFTALVSGQAPKSFKKQADGTFLIVSDLIGTGNNGISQGNGLVPVTVYLTNSSVTISKNFKVGTVPILSKIEVTEVKYSNGTKLSAEGDTASVGIKLYDNYGNPIIKDQFKPYSLNGTTTSELSANNINPQITPWEKDLVIVKDNGDYTDYFDENDDARVKVKLNKKLDKTADYTVSIYGGSSSTTATVSVGAGNVATKIGFDTSAVFIGANDSSVVVPLDIADANGNKLSAQDIADNDKDGRFNFTNSSGSAAIVRTGADKGKLKLTFANGSLVQGNKVYLSGQINQSQTNTFVRTEIPVGEARTPDKLEVSTAPSVKAVLGAKDEIKWAVKDQNNQSFDPADFNANIIGANGQVFNYQVVVTVRNQNSSTNATPKVAGVSTVNVVSPLETTYTFAYDKLNDFAKGFDITTTSNVEGKVTVSAVIQKKINSGAFSDYASAPTKTLDAIKSDVSLTYSINTIGNLFAAQDKLSSVYNGTGQLDPGATNNPFDKKISIVAKDAAGNKVKLPLNYVRGISTSDSTIIKSAPIEQVDAAFNPDHVNQNGFIVGNKAGTATVTATVYTNKGDTIYLSQEVTVKADSIVTDSIVAGKSSNKLANVSLLPGQTQIFAYQFFTKDSDNQLKVKDQYGIEYKNAEIADNSKVLGILYTVAVNTGTGNVDINSSTGAINSIASTVDEFTITATAPNGKSVQVLVTRN
ncbi:S-layer homology domain-containing protein [Paenibacillus sp. HWE-109]|uniref:S-layer homology domain-containing protein n=1 Tax=Paenibacillus sp. HWE-109 TaxID=1306526 RepID=UPI001EDFAFF3|nr:S-layer homology domain-containing protein [Paenibacillus sp. HWE-109]UKS26118.1 S-layer homology domain-containing protein [Paenibacillus sp. HWE-109]